MKKQRKHYRPEAKVAKGAVTTRQCKVHTQLGRAAVRIFAANDRMNWVRLTAPHLKVPRQLNRAHCTPQQARVGLAESAARCAEMLAEALGGCGGRIEKFRRDGWAQPWPVGVEMLCYMIAHEAHHRGQVCMLAHQMGFPLATEVASGIWNWEKLWNEIIVD